MRKQILHRALFLLAGLILTGLFMLMPGNVLAANPTTINFQGKVTNPDGTNETACTSSCAFVFRLYDQSSPSTTGSCASNAHCWWEETDTLTVTNGIFQVQLGAGCAFSGACNSSHSGINWNTNNALYLTLQFNGDSAGFMSPTIPLSSVPYAFNADNSSNLGGVAAANYVQFATGSTQTDSSTNNSIVINKTGASGNILLLEANSQTALAVTNSGVVQVQSAGGLVLGTSSTAGLLTLYNGSNSISIQGAAGTAAYSLILPVGAGSSNQCLANTSTPGTLQWLPCGAGSTAVITLSAEYPGAVMTGDGGTNTGTMTSDFCSGSSHLGIPSSGNPCGATQEMNYYSWTANATNDYDVWVRWQAPSDIASSSSFGTVSISGWTSSTSDSVQMTFYNSSGTSCGSATVSAASASFSSASFTPNSSCNVSGGQYITIRVHLNVGVTGEYARAGDITINYNRQ